MTETEMEQSYSANPTQTIIDIIDNSGMKHLSITRSQVKTRLTLKHLNKMLWSPQIIHKT